MEIKLDSYYILDWGETYMGENEWLLYGKEFSKDYPKYSKGASRCIDVSCYSTTPFKCLAKIPACECFSQYKFENMYFFASENGEKTFCDRVVKEVKFNEVW